MQSFTGHPVIFCVQLLCTIAFIRRKAISYDKCFRQRIWVTDWGRVCNKWLWCFALRSTQWEIRPRGHCLFVSLNITKLWKSLLKLLAFLLCPWILSKYTHRSVSLCVAPYIALVAEVSKCLPLSQQKINIQMSVFLLTLFMRVV